MGVPSSSDDVAGAGTTTDDRIIAATLALITEHGFGAVTMSRVADASGVARQTLYNHYGDIDGIVAAAIDRHNRESLDLLDAALRVAESPTAKIKQMVRHFVMVGAHAHHALDLTNGLSAIVRATLGTYRTTVEQQISDVLEDGQRCGDFRPDLTPNIDAVLVRATLDGLHELAAERPSDASQIASTGTRTILAALN